MAFLGNFSVCMKRTLKGGRVNVASRSTVSAGVRNRILMCCLS